MPIKNISDLETKLHLAPGTLKSAIDSTVDTDVDITNLEIVPKTDYTTRIENIKTDSFNNGKAAGAETKIKEIKDAFGLDISGEKIKTIPVTEIKTMVTTKVLAEANVAPDKKVQELTTDLATMTGQWNAAKTEKENLENTYKQKENQRTIHSSVMGALPAKLIIPADEVAELTIRKAAAAGITPDIDPAAGLVWKKGDVIQKDANLVPLKSAEVLKDFFTPYVSPVQGGGGGADGGGQAKPGTYAAFEEEMKTAGHQPGTQKFNEEMQKRVTAKTLTM